MDVVNRLWLSFAFTVSVLVCYQIACVKRKRDSICKFRRRQKGELTEVVQSNGSNLQLPLSLQTRETLFLVVRRGVVIHTAVNSEQGNRSPVLLFLEHLSLLLFWSLQTVSASTINTTRLYVVPEVSLKSAGSSVTCTLGAKVRHN